MSNNSITSQELYEKRKIRIGLIGMGFGVIAAIAAVSAGVFSGMCNPLISNANGLEISDQVIITLLTSWIFVSAADFIAGCFGCGFLAMSKRNPAKEIKRTAGLKVSWYMMVATLIAGPGGTVCMIASYAMCGMTMGACVLAFTPLVLSVMSKFILKESLSPRVYLGICILVIGTCVAGIAPVERSALFIPGIIVAFCGAVCFSLEGVASTYAADLIDEYVGCTFFRCWGSGIMCLVISLIVAAVSGNLEFYIDYFTGFWTVVPYIGVIGGFLNFVQYYLIYDAFVKCGPARCQAMVYTMPVVSIPIGLIGHAAFGNLYEYSVSPLVVVGAVIVVIGVMFITAKPSELLNLRDN